MPVPYHKENLHVPGKRYRLGEAARAGVMLSVRCFLCHRPGAVFYASDLVKILDPDRDTFAPPFPCTYCKTEDYVTVKIRSPYDADVGKLIVRRLVAVRQTPLWRNEVYGDSPPPSTIAGAEEERAERAFRELVAKVDGDEEQPISALTLPDVDGGLLLRVMRDLGDGRVRVAMSAELFLRRAK